ncbi:MAG: response regulator transcription factor [Verrucomicrobia bacterium]|nr:response regulator transcription factor [Verrucomicrobiota bacterium]
MKIRTLIVDDEPLARERLATLLQEEADIEIVGQCADGQEALAAIRSAAPDLVFLDVQMPELDGFGVVAALPRVQVPAVIFVTAYDQFAVRAFEVNALDYLLKPFDRERFQTALRRAVDQILRHEPAEINRRLTQLLAELKRDTKPLERLVVKTEGRVLLVKTDEIDWIEAADNYVSLHVGNESHLHRETMAALERKLAPNQFLRISRSTIVNVERIKELQPMFHGDYVVILRDGTRLSLSRNFRDRVQHLLGKE